MSRKNPVEIDNEFVAKFQAALSRKLGRPAAARKVKNYNELWITDPVYSFIQRGMQKGVTGKQCAGQVQGAHIKPHAFSGLDKAENGLWLCEHHHRATEGKLQGTRGAVRFVSN
jgi:hypothetical protein